MLLDIQGSSFKLYDPKIAATDLLSNDASLGPKEVNFCAGNLSVLQVMNVIQSTLVISIVRCCLSKNLIKIDRAN